MHRMCMHPFIHRHTTTNHPPPHPYPAGTAAMASRIEYSEKYMDDKHEYRHVILPKELARSLPKQRWVVCRGV